MLPNPEQKGERKKKEQLEIKYGKKIPQASVATDLLRTGVSEGISPLVLNGRLPLEESGLVIYDR